MSKSDITYDSSAFDPKNIPENTKNVNKYLISQALNGSGGLTFWEIGAEKFRSLQDEGKTSWPAPTFRLDHATYINIPSRENGREIKCRLVQPQNRKAEGVFLYSHGGGHVLGRCDWNDEFLDVIAKAANVAVISTEYRLAPENPFPAGEEDVFDVAEYLVDNAPNLYGGPLKFIGGESAGATLSISTIVHLLETRPNFQLAGAAMMYGLYDWSLSPSVRTFTAPLIMTTKHVEHYGEAYLGKMSLQERRDPAISPIYHPIFKYPGSTLETSAIGGNVKLPPALFLSGTKDATLDDTVLMSFRYQVAGGDARVKFVEGAPHSFLLFPADRFEMVARGRAILTEFLQEMLHENSTRM